MGPTKPNGVPKHVFKLLCGAFESFVGIQQANGDKSETRKELSAQLNGAISIVAPNPLNSPNLLNRVLKETAINLRGSYKKS